MEPFILIRRNRQDQLLISLVFIAAQKEGDSVVWSEKYYYHFKDKLPAEILSSNDGAPLQKLLTENMQVAVTELSQFLISDASGKLADGSEMVLNSQRFGPFPIPFKGYTVKNDNGRLLIRVIANNINNLFARGMHIIAKNDVEFQ